MHMSREPRSEERSIFASLTHGRGRVIGLVALVLALGVSSLLAFVAMRAPAAAPTTGHVTGPR
jgi:hypothetical protein